MTSSEVWNRVLGHARTQPKHCAVLGDGGPMSYGELAALAAELASQLLTHGVRPGNFVAIVANRSPATIVAMLATLSIGAGYAPISPAIPEQRKRAMLRAVRPATVVETHNGTFKITGRGSETTRTSSIPPGWIVFTSGTTGTPKGVLIAQRSLEWHARTMSCAFQLGRSDSVLHAAGIDFDVAAEEIWPTLYSGATIVILGTPLGSIDYPTFTEFLSGRGVSICNLPSSYFAGWAHVLESNAVTLPSVRLVIAGSESLPLEAAISWTSRPDRPSLMNAYGISEATVTSILTTVRAERLIGEGRVPIGRALPGVRCRLVDADLRPLANGCHGELVLGGEGLALEYLDDEPLTAARFSTDESGERWFATGDIVTQHGTELYFGRRVDEQINYLGYRIEPNEIRSALLATSAVVDARVLLVDRELVACVVAPQDVDTGQLERDLRAKLPKYMIPAAILRFDGFPTTSGGKVDQARLLSDARTRLTSPSPERLGTTPVIDEVVAMARLVVGDAVQDGNTHFFHAGGTSLAAARFVAAINRRYGISATLDTVFAAPVLRDLTERLRDE
ncbi:MAG: non-ribosomal peptide synthetase [Chloroflexota bacterium]